MVKLNQILVSDWQMKTFVVLPNEGDGDILLDRIGIPFEIVPSRNWVVDIEEGKTEEREKAAELPGNAAAIHTNPPFVWHIREFLKEDKHRKIWNRDMNSWEKLMM